jgi:hypothetical protein
VNPICRNTSRVHVTFSNVTWHNVTWMGVAKKNGDRFYDFVDSEAQCLFYKNRRAENTQIPSPWLFFMGSHRSTHDSGIKRASYYFKKLVRSPPRVMPRSKIHTVECNNGNALQNAYVVTSLRHTVLLRQSHVTSSSHGAWRMERDSFARSFDQTTTWSRA